ncbi:hypothetical protein [Kingella potus]|uniref:hypothetical protein n=1 Tax=Kingella potus TaxID=265175 RepID=UPI001FD2131B|nr:hypothetical protein [Kingella potus]UOP01055.1 hypothetical protein LVJ84_01405 [Kingella potus]
MWRSHARVPNISERCRMRLQTPIQRPTKLPPLRPRGGGLGRGWRFAKPFSRPQTQPKRQSPHPNPSPAGGRGNRGRLKIRIVWFQTASSLQKPRASLGATHPTRVWREEKRTGRLKSQILFSDGLCFICPAPLPHRPAI